jgi:hypothetical protein
VCVAPWAQEFIGHWEGTYQDLDLEYLTIRVWSYNRYGVNELLGTATEPLDDIARTKMDRVVYIFRNDPIAAAAAAGGMGAATRELGCTLSFKLELQENFVFLIDFKDWEVISTAVDVAEMEPGDPSHPLYKALLASNKARNGAGSGGAGGGAGANAADGKNGAGAGAADGKNADGKKGGGVGPDGDGPGPDLHEEVEEINTVCHLCVVCLNCGCWCRVLIFWVCLWDVM